MQDLVQRRIDARITERGRATCQHYLTLQWARCGEVERVERGAPGGTRQLMRPQEGLEKAFASLQAKSRIRRNLAAMA